MTAFNKASLEDQLRDQHEELAMFAARTSHDLISPLNNIMMYAELLGEDLDRGQTNLARQKSTILQELCATTLNTVERLSEYARHGRTGIPFQTTDLNDYVALTIRTLERQIRRADAKIQIDSLPTVMGDPIGLSLLFQNLIENALKFRRPTSLQIDISAKKTEKYWQFAVRDNGIGIEEKYFDEIFRPFARIHNRKQYGGTGLGLATCKKILWQHGGEIWVASIPNKGSTFYFTIPE